MNSGFVEDHQVKYSRFRRALEMLINRNSMENGSDTPDFLLAEYLSRSLELFDNIVERREQWHGRNKHLAEGNNRVHRPNGLRKKQNTVPTSTNATTGSVPCACGNTDAYWTGDTLREYACARCHGLDTGDDLAHAYDMISDSARRLVTHSFDLDFEFDMPLSELKLLVDKLAMEYGEDAKFSPTDIMTRKKK